MKKMYAVLLVLCVGILFTGVNCGSETTEIGWVHGSGDGETYSQIVWKDDTDNVNQQWSESITAGKQTASKEITKLTGYGETVSTATGGTVTIYVDSNGDGFNEKNFTANEGSSTMYTIKQAN
jgi:hypothetical protein